MKEEEVQKIIAKRAFRRGLLAGAKEFADVVFRTVDDPDVLEKLLIDFKVLGIKLAKANVEVEFVDLREEQEEEKDAEKEIVVKHDVAKAALIKGIKLGAETAAMYIDDLFDIKRVCGDRNDKFH